MKNKLSILLLTLPLIAGCTTPQYEHNLSIVAPTGAPAVAFYNYAEDNLFETNAEASTGILPLMVQGKKDVVVLPTNAGVQAIVGKNAPYKIAATITFGNLYLCSTGHDTNNTLDGDDYVVLFQQGNLPDLVFQYVYSDYVSAHSENLHYVGAASDASKILASGKDLTNDNADVDYVLLAEPAVSTVLAKNTNAKIYADLQALYKEKSGGLELFQASIFIKNDVDHSKATTFLSSIEKDIKEGLSNPTKIVEGISKASDPSAIYGVAPSIIPSVITPTYNGLGLGYKAAKGNKAAIDKFLALFNIAETNEEIYF